MFQVPIRGRKNGQRGIANRGYKFQVPIRGRKSVKSEYNGSGDLTDCFRFPLGGINGVLCLLSIERLSSQLEVERTCLERKAKLQQNFALQATAKLILRRRLIGVQN